jgi:predicted Kef-type K+ transport protein
MQADIIAIGMAFLFGLAARLAGMLPLVGYL